MGDQNLENAINLLAKEFDAIEWQFQDSNAENPKEKIQLWPGAPKDDIMVCVYKGNHINQVFHQQNFFFLNYAYQGNYDAISYEHDNRIVVHEGECYVGQPYAGYAPNSINEEEIMIVGVLIQTKAFFKTFFQALAIDSHLFHFFLDPQINEHSNDFLQIKFDDVCPFRSLLDLMIIEYANRQESSQDILRPLTLTLLMQLARQYKKTAPIIKEERLSDQIVRYMNEHLDTVNLKDTAAHFSYHPNYISSLVHKELGRSFSEIQLEQRMNRAEVLLKGTSLSIEEIATMLGYSNPSNFYKAFRSYFHVPPREYLELQEEPAK